MDSSHVATGAITALLATALIYFSKWPLQPLELKIEITEDVALPCGPTLGNVELDLFLRWLRLYVSPNITLR